MGWSVLLSVVVLSGSYMVACGGATRGVDSKARGASDSSSRGGASPISFGVAQSVHGLKGDEEDDELESKTRGSEPNGDEDGDNDNDVRDNATKGYYDNDDTEVSEFGHAANAVDTRALVSVVKRYYEAAATDDGSTACSLMLPDFARSVPEDYGRSPGPGFLRGAKTCAAVASRLFKHEHFRLTGALLVTGVRVRGDSAYVLLGSKTVPASFVILERGRQTWGILGLLAGVLP